MTHSFSGCSRAGVKAVAGRILFSGMLSTRNLSSVALLVAIDPKRKKSLSAEQ